MKKLKITIAVIIAIIFILIVSIFVVSNNKNINNILQDNRIGESENPVKEQEEQHITIQKYNATKAAIGSYLSFLNKNNSSFINGDGERSVTDENIQKAIYNLLSKNYVQENNINENNVFEKIKSTEKKLIFSALDMEQIGINGYVTTILASGILTINNEDFIEEASFIVNLDMKNLTFSVEPTEKDGEHEKYMDTSINKNEDNTYKLKNTNIEKLSQEYIDLYKRIVTKAPQLIYKKLDEAYAKKRFGSQEKFEQYVNSNKEELEKIVFSKYLVNTYVGYTEYVCQDQYGRLYIFKVKEDILDYTIELDDYTLPDEELDKQYMNLSTQAKVVNNINKWIKMLNNRDYEAAFNVLDETFRTQNFDNDVDNFEEYMREHFPEHYDFEQIEYSEESGISVQSLTLKNITGGTLDEEIQETIYMQIGEETDFVMSFNVI